MSMALGITTAPWIIKPVWGMCSDCLPLFGYRRKSYLILWGIVSFLCWLAMAFWVKTFNMAIGILLLNQVACSFSNVIGEALIVISAQKSNENDSNSEEDKQGEAANSVSLFFGVRSFGTFLTAYTGGVLLEYVTKSTVFALTALFPLTLTFAAFFMPDEKVKFYKNTQNTAELESLKENE